MIRYKRSFQVEIAEPDRVFLFSEKSSHMLKGSLYVLLSKYLKEGKFSSDAIADLMSETVPHEETYHALHRLEKYIEPLEPSLSDSFAAFCHLLDLNPRETWETLKKAKIYIKNFGRFKIEPLQELFRSLYVELVDRPEEADIGVAVVENYFEEKLKGFFRERTHPWFLLKPAGEELWIGPLFPKEKGQGCWECLLRRFQEGRLEEFCYVQNTQNRKFPFPHSLGHLDVTVGMGFHLAALEVFKWIACPQNAKTERKILSFNATSLEVREHVLVPVPTCSGCGQQAVALHPTQELKLQSRKKLSLRDGGYRCVDPEETIKRYAHHVSPLLGIVTSLEPVSIGNSPFLHAYKGGHNFALSNSLLGISPNEVRSVSGGKGRSASQAKASCLCETLERYSGIFQGNEPQVQASYLELKDEAIDPRQLLLISEKQYQNRHDWNRTMIQKYRILEPFQPEEKIVWTPLWSMTKKTYRYAPTAFCYYGASTLTETRICIATSNGAAAGNCIEEAILQGFFELVERDSLAIWWFNRLVRPRVDLTSFSDPYFELFVEEYQKMGREVWVLDITADLEVPSFAALSRRINSEQEEIIFGFGTHFDPKIAISRALTEMNQSFPRTQHFEKKKKTIEAEIIYNWLTKATIKLHPYLYGSEECKTARDYPFQENEDLLEDILFCQKIVENRGMEMLVLDQTRPEIGLSVAKVVVPGMRHYYPCLAPGRLYDVPVKLGWEKVAKTESEMNRTPMVF